MIRKCARQSALLGLPKLLCLLVGFLLGLCADLAAQENDKDAIILRALAEMRCPSPWTSVTLNFRKIADCKTESVRLIGRVISLPGEVISDEDANFLATVLSLLGGSDRNKPALRPMYYEHSKGVLQRSLDSLVGLRKVDRQEWAKWAEKVPDSVLSNPLPVLSVDDLCSLLLSTEPFSGTIIHEAAIILAQQKLAKEVLEKIVKQLSQSGSASFRDSLVSDCCMVLAAAGSEGQQMLLQVLPNMTKREQEIATVELLLHENAECVNKVFERLSKEEWQEACNIILRTRSDALTAKLFRFAQENARVDILSYSLSEARRQDMSPVLTAILNTKATEEEKKGLLSSLWTNVFGLDRESGQNVVLNALQTAKRASAAHWFEMKVRTALSGSVTLTTVGLDKQTRKVRLEFRNHTELPLWINTAALWQAGESVTERVLTKTGWEAKGFWRNTFPHSQPWEFFPREQDLIEVKPHGSAEVDYTPKLLSKADGENIQLTITYWNSVDQYFCPEGNSLTLKSNKKVFQGFLSTSLSIPAK